MRISTVRHHGFWAVVLAGTATATGWILSRSDVVDASEEQTSSYREAYAQSDAEIKTVEDPQGLRLNYYDARWSRVLNDVSKHAELTLVMDKIPAGRFARRDKTRYGTDDCIRILNRELEGLGFRLLKQGNFLIVLHLDQARSRYARPVLPSASAKNNQTAMKDKRPVRTASARVDQPNAQWASDDKDTFEDTRTRRPASTTTIPIRTSAFQEPQDTVRQPNTNETASTEGDLPGAVIRNVEVRHATATEVARAVYLVFERRAELIPKGLQNKPTFVVYDTDDTEKEGEPLFRIGIDQQQNSLIVEAGAKRADQLVKLLQRLDKPQTDKQNNATRLVPSEEISEETVEDLNKQLRHLVAMKAQENAANPEVSRDEPSAAPEVADSTAFNLRGDVNIQAMQGTGTLLIEGNDEDLERLLPIIRRLEQLSIGSLPDIHLLELKHVNSEAFAEMLTTVYDRLSELRKRGDDDQQSVAFFPVGQPNSVLILAPQLELPAILALAEKLDTKLDPDSEFDVFPLKHAIASQVVAALASFYEERPGLRTRIRSIADVRTNTVIVQGHPRDLVEVQRLIDGLDRDEPGAVHQVKVIELNHATAEELAEVLNGAIQAATSPPQTSGGNGSSGFGGNQGPQELRDTKSIALEFLATDGDAQQLIRSGFLVDVRINADPRSNALIVSAPEASISLLQALITTLDRAPSAIAAIKVFALKNADAEQSVALLSTMFENTNQDEQLGVQIAGAEDAASSLIPLQFSADIRTNSVLAVGSEEALSIVEAILLRLDTDDTRQRTTTVIPLRNAPAELVADSINRFLGQQQSLWDSTDDLISNIERVRQEVIVAEDTNSNSLIVSASPDYFSQITQIINDLDATPPQVIIQALIVEVQLNNTDEFGIELGFQDPLLFSRSIVEDAADLITIPTTTLVPGVGNVESTTIITQNSTPGFNFNNTAAPLGNNAGGNTGAVGGQGISSFSLGRQNGDLGFGGFVFSAQSDAVNVLIRALAARRTVHVLSRPQIRTTHNNEATIRVGQEVPVVNGVIISDGVVSPDIESVDTGIILRVRPRITPDGTVAMDVYAEKSALTAGGVPVFTDIATGNTIESQIRDVSLAETTVNIPNGQTIVIGGMITKTDDTIERKVPWLGDLPVLGKAFRYDSNSTTRTELLIFLTPRIIYGDVDSELIKQIESERMHFLESEAEEIHGPIYSVPPSTTPTYEGLVPSRDPLVPSIPSETPAYQTQSRQRHSSEADDRAGIRTTSGRRDSTSSQVRSAQLSSDDEEAKESWVRKFMKKKRSSKPEFRSSPGSNSTSGTESQDFDFDDQEWN
jgi:general secretion pathway protein D